MAVYIEDYEYEYQLLTFQINPFIKIFFNSNSLKGNLFLNFIPLAIYFNFDLVIF